MLPERSTVQPLANVENILVRQGLEKQQIADVVISADRLGVRVDHDGFETHLAGRERRMYAAIIELNALPNTVRPAAKNDHFRLIVHAEFVVVAFDQQMLVVERAIAKRRVDIQLFDRRPEIDAAARLMMRPHFRNSRLAMHDLRKRPFVRRIVIRRIRFKLRRTCIDQLEFRPVELRFEFLQRLNIDLPDVPQLHVAISECLGFGENFRDFRRQPKTRARGHRRIPKPLLKLNQLVELIEEPDVDFRELMNSLDAPTHLERIANVVPASLARRRDFVRQRFFGDRPRLRRPFANVRFRLRQGRAAERRLHAAFIAERRHPHRGVVRIAFVGLLQLVHQPLVVGVQAVAVPLDLHRAHALLKRLLERAANRHRFADGFHRGRERLVGFGEFLKRESRHFHHAIVDRRLEARRRLAGDVVANLVERVADRQLGCDFRDRKAGRLAGQRRAARDARVHLDRDHPPGFRIGRELNIRPARLHPHRPHDRDRGVAHPLVFLVAQSQRRRDRDRIAGMHAHRVDVLDRAHDHDVVRPVAHHLQLVFLPARQILFDQNLRDGRAGQPVVRDVLEFLHRASHAAAGAAKCVRRSNANRQLYLLQDRARFLIIVRNAGARHIHTDTLHGRLIFRPILCPLNRRRVRADHAAIVLGQYPRLERRHRAIQTRLPADGRQNRAHRRAPPGLDRQNLVNHVRRNRLDIGAVGGFGVGHDRCGIAIQQYDADALLAQRPARLRSGIIEFAGLTDDDRTAADDEHALKTGISWHGSPPL